MIKWIIEILKRIFMNPQTTDRTTEDTNIVQKKIISRLEKDMGTPSVSAGTYTYYVTQNIPYQKAGINNYAFDSFIDYHILEHLFQVKPVGYCVLNPATGLMSQEFNVTMSSYVDPSGNFVNMTYQYVTGEVPYYINFKAFSLLYSTSITSESIW